MPRPLNEVAFTAGFLSQAKAEGMTAAEMDGLVELLSKNPEAGVLIVGSGGCRKVRLARTGGGKSGGYRVVTFFARQSMPVYVFAVLAKGSRETFSDDEIKAMAAASQRILKALKSKTVG